jgi:hypothetical protein
MTDPSSKHDQPERRTAPLVKAQKPMNTTDLINSLAADSRQMVQHKTRKDLASGVVIGGIVTLGALLAVFGVQPGLGQIDHLLPLLMKLAFVAAIGVPAFVVADQLARPDRGKQRIARLVAVPMVLLGILAIAQIALAPSTSLPELVFGGSWRQCPARIAVLSLPILAGLLWAVRRQAPVHLRRAGMTAGLVAGTAAAAIYALACTEVSATFVLIWYSCGIAVTTMIGALIGPRALRW